MFDTDNASSSSYTANAGLDELLIKLKHNVREHEQRYFTDQELSSILDSNYGDLRKASYEALIKKANDELIRLPSGLQLSGGKDYWLRLARLYAPSLTGVIKRGDWL